MPKEISFQCNKQELILSPHYKISGLSLLLMSLLLSDRLNFKDNKLSEAKNGSDPIFN